MTGATKSDLDTAIRALQATLDNLGQERNTLDAQIDSVRSAMSILEHQASQGMLTTGGGSPYAGLGATSAVTKFLRENPGTKYKASEIRRHLERRGFGTQAKAVDSLISATLSRLAHVARSAIKEAKRNNVKVYWFEKDESPKTELAYSEEKKQAPSAATDRA